MGARIPVKKLKFRLCSSVAGTGKRRGAAVLLRRVFQRRVESAVLQAVGIAGVGIAGQGQRHHRNGPASSAPRRFVDVARQRDGGGAVAAIHLEGQNVPIAGVHAKVGRQRFVQGHGNESFSVHDGEPAGLTGGVLDLDVAGDGCARGGGEGAEADGAAAFRPQVQIDVGVGAGHAQHRAGAGLPRFEDQMVDGGGAVAGGDEDRRRSLGQSDRAQPLGGEPHRHVGVASLSRQGRCPARRGAGGVQPVDGAGGGGDAELFGARADEAVRSGVLGGIDDVEVGVGTGRADADLSARRRPLEGQSVDLVRCPLEGGCGAAPDAAQSHRIVGSDGEGSPAGGAVPQEEIRVSVRSRVLSDDPARIDLDGAAPGTRMAGGQKDERVVVLARRSVSDAGGGRLHRSVEAGGSGEGGSLAGRIGRQVDRRRGLHQPDRQMIRGLGHGDHP